MPLRETGAFMTQPPNKVAMTNPIIEQALKTPRSNSVRIGGRDYVVSGGRPAYSVTDDRGATYTVWWTTPRGVVLKLPACDCSEEKGPDRVCVHVQATYEHDVGAHHAAKFPLVRKPEECTIPMRPRPPRIAEADQPAIRQKVAAALARGLPVVTGEWPVYTVTIGQEVWAVVHDTHNQARCSCNPQHLGWRMTSCVHVAIAYEYDTAVSLFAQRRAGEDLIECARTGIVTQDALKCYYEETARRRNASQARYSRKA
jgi:hypothetical protein